MLHPISSAMLCLYYIIFKMYNVYSFLFEPYLSDEWLRSMYKYICTYTHISMNICIYIKCYIFVNFQVLLSLIILRLMLLWTEEIVGLILMILDSFTNFVD